MNILILGFNDDSRGFVDKVKRFADYGQNKSLSVYHIFVTRNSLSYGEDLVVEIPDPHGDGYRTYRDGLQAIDGYSTTVSDFLPWLLEEAKSESFDVIIDFLPEHDPDAGPLLTQLKESATSKVRWLDNKSKSVEELLNEVRLLSGGSLPIHYVDFSEKFKQEAAALWEEAKVKMRLNHISNRKKDVDKYGHPDKSMSGLGYAYLPCIPKESLGIISHVTGEYMYYDQPKSRYHSEYIDVDHNCKIIEDSILVGFLGSHYVEQVACRAFSNPYLKIKSARYVKYLDDNASHISLEDSDYVVEFIYKGTLKVLPTREPLFIEYGQPYEYLVFSGVDESAGYPYRPSTNLPADRIVERDLETIIFTFEEDLEESRPSD